MQTRVCVPAPRPTPTVTPSRCDRDREPAAVCSGSCLPVRSWAVHLVSRTMTLVPGPVSPVGALRLPTGQVGSQ